MNWKISLFLALKQFKRIALRSFSFGKTGCAAGYLSGSFRSFSFGKTGCAAGYLSGSQCMFSHKRAVIFQIAVVVLSTCLGCSAKPKIEKNDFMFYNDDKSVGYGSTVDEVEKVFGTSFEKTFLGNDYGMATVLFRDDKAVYIIIEPDGNKNLSNNLWVTSKGIGIGSKERDLQKAYELTDADKFGNVAYDIPLKADGDNLVKCSIEEAEYYLSFYVIGNYINRIALADIVATKTLK